MSDLQHRADKSDKERQEAVQELETLREHIDQLQTDCDRYLDEKKTYSNQVGKKHYICMFYYKKE